MTKRSESQDSNPGLLTPSSGIVLLVPLLGKPKGLRQECPRLQWRKADGGTSLVVKWLRLCAPNAGDLDSIPRLGRSPGERNGNPFQYSCLENPMDGGAWQGTVHEIAKSQTRLRNFSHL